jgi:hypothetical protein
MKKPQAKNIYLNLLLKSTENDVITHPSTEYVGKENTDTVARFTHTVANIIL